jgi:cytochrome c peroxidase
VGVAWSPWLTWDGKADSLWSQALLPLENPAEHGLDRTAFAHLMARDHAEAYEAIFGPLPPLEERSRFPLHAGPLGNAEAQAAWAAMAPADQEAINRVFVNGGKALAAFQRTLAPGPSRFDLWAEALAAERPPAPEATLSAVEQAGLRLFIGKAQCLNCHNGPLLSNNSFHNTGVPPLAGQPIDRGRAAALEGLAATPFTCLGPYSDAVREDFSQCATLRFLPGSATPFEAAFRTPSLRNVAQTAPYMHAGQIPSLAQALAHYNQGGLPPMVGHNELAPLNLRAAELAQLEAFLGALTQTTPVLPAAPRRGLAK